MTGPFSVAVTARAQTAARLAAALAARHLSPIELPCVRIEPCRETIEEARDAAMRADLLFVTSTTTVGLLWGATPLPTPVLAVGPRTAEAVRMAGGVVVQVGTGGAEALAEVACGLVRERQVLWPGARDHDETVVARLRGAGADAAHYPIYRTEPVAPATTPAVAAAVFASPSAVAGWRRSRNLTDQRTIAIGSTTAAAIEHAGGSVDATAAGPDPDAVAACAVDVLHAPPIHDLTKGPT